MQAPEILDDGRHVGAGSSVEEADGQGSDLTACGPPRHFDGVIRGGQHLFRFAQKNLAR